MKKIIAITLVILIGAFVIFNFWAAHKAEQQIDQTLQAQADSTAYSVQYSSVNIRPFAGNVIFDDLTVIGNNRIQRAKKMIVDLRYIDFIDIYFGGLKYGLRSVTSGQVDMKEFSWISRQSTQQVSMGNVSVNYEGQLWDGLQHFLADRPLTQTQKLNIQGDHFSYRKSAQGLGNFKSDSIFIKLDWPQKTAHAKMSSDSVHLIKTTWIPPHDFQQKYAFFIKGFGFKQDSIPVSSAAFSASSLNHTSFHITNGRLKTTLFNLTFDGRLVRDSTWSTAQLSPLNINLTHLSPKFKNVLTNIQKMLGKKMPTVKNHIRFKLAGPLTSPHIIPPPSMQ